MWTELQGSYQIAAGQANGAISLPADGRGKTTGLILIGLFAHVAAANNATITIVSGGTLGTVTIPIPTLTIEKHFNHLLFTPITSITIANFGANDMWLFEFVRMSNT